MRIADAAYAAEDVIESYTVGVIKLGRTTTTHDQETNSGIENDSEKETTSSSSEKTNSGEEIDSEEEISSGEESGSGEEICSSGGESDSGEEICSSGGESDSGEEICSSGEESDSGEEIRSSGEESDSGEETKFSSSEEINIGEEMNSREEVSRINFYRDLHQVIQDMDMVKKVAMEMNAEKAVVHDQRQRNISASVDSSERNGIMVGSDDVLLELMDKLTAGGLDRQVIPIVGMSGIGKTTLARYIYSQSLIKEHFDICAWATFSQQYDTREILYQLLCQATRANKERKEQLSKMSEDELGLRLYQYLSHRRFLILMDDMWSIEAWDNIQLLFPHNNNGSRILATTRLLELSSQLNNNYGLQMKFLDEVSSWNLFSETVFREKSCPLELEKVGKKIVENCRGLPLSIVVIGGLLKKLERTRDCWKSIRKNLNSIVNLENDEYCLKMLKMGYDHLPTYLRPCFLYMGVFEEDHAIRVSTLVKLWVSEGFLKPISNKSLETIAKEYLKELVNRNLVLIDELGSSGNIKYCKIHDLLRDLCLREAHKDRFYHVIGQNCPQGINRQRRIVIPSSSSKKEVLDALQSMSHARSFIFHREKVLLGPNYGLLRTLHEFDKSMTQTYEYSLENLFQLVNLRYIVVELRSISKFSSSVSLLWNLHTLIVFSYQKFDAPAEIWGMSQLRHVEFVTHNLYLPDPPRRDDNVVVMENLQTLKGVWNFKCGEEMVKRIPNIKKLTINYEEVEGTESHGDYYCVSNFECLRKLESLTCRDGCKRVHCLQKLSFADSLKRLDLEVWDDFDWTCVLEKIGSLPLLEELVLRNGCFSGEWRTVEGEFPCLKFLKLFWCHLIQWTTEESCVFPRLEQLHLCYLRELEEIPCEIGNIPTLQKIELFYCSKSAVKSAKNIVEEQEDSQGEEELPFYVLVKLRRKNKALQSLATPNFKVEVTD